jgi:hypothetical protein
MDAENLGRANFIIDQRYYRLLLSATDNVKGQAAPISSPQLFIYIQ